MKIKLMIKIFLFFLAIATTCYADAPIAPRYDTGTYPSKNYIKNPDAELNDLFVTDASNIHSRSTSSPLEGKGSHLIDASSSGQVVVFTTYPLDAKLAGQNCEIVFHYSGDASLYKAYAKLSSTKLTSDLQLINTGSGLSKKVQIFFPCGAAADTPNLTIEATSNSAAAIKVDSVYLGLCNDCLSSKSVQSFSASIAADGTVSGENTDWITGNCANGSTGHYTCTLNSGVFSVAPNCVVVGNYGINNSGNTTIESTSTTEVKTQTVENNIYVARATYLICNKSTDSFQDAVKLDCSNNANCENEFSAKIANDGTVSAESTDFINGNCSLSTATFTCTLATGLFSASPNCNLTVNENAADSASILLTTNSTTQIIYTTLVNRSTSALATILHCSRQLSDKKPVSNVPILVGSITSGSTGARRLESATFTSGGVVSSSSSSWATSSGTSPYTITIVAGTFSAVPSCWCDAINGTNNDVCSISTVTSSTSVDAWVRNATTGTSVSSRPFSIFCEGPK